MSQGFFSKQYLNFVEQWYKRVYVEKGVQKKTGTRHGGCFPIS